MARLNLWSFTLCVGGDTIKHHLLGLAGCWPSDDDDDDDDGDGIYIYYNEVCVCVSEKSLLPTSELSDGGAK